MNNEFDKSQRILDLITSDWKFARSVFRDLFREIENSEEYRQAIFYEVIAKGDLADFEELWHLLSKHAKKPKA